ncbi:transglutaminase-like putative cysteine protease [Cytobacillus eiseniae]|uniref:Transglutaminase-like putative cysteine protease n=1 Tax=Cytobacillus eiseniae TaxID=762947 RepID=A0ABS4RDQ1_9BACI|nr:transglutaminase family protein [Cytobacillus eiseniae]MBP2241029.1 transglutaminase-like putative cysteine protease [Cytobacillus eiseniae]
MQLILSEKNLEVYLEKTDIINFRHSLIQKKLDEFRKKGQTKRELAEMAFLFVRDEIQHSFDKESEVITISASDTLENGEGICFAKAHLLAAFLRGMDIPAGFCYQRVTRKGTPESGYALHGLNAVYLDDINQWFRLDPRGNKPGVYSEFSISPEKLAYPIRTQLDEMDYPFVYKDPLESVIYSMEQSINCKELFFNRPESIIINSNILKSVKKL